MSASITQTVELLLNRQQKLRLNRSAIFFADKLASITSSNLASANPLDDKDYIRAIYRLAESFFDDNQFKRCKHLLINTSLATNDLQSLYLASRCAAEENEWDECLELIGEDDDFESQGIKNCSDLNETSLLLSGIDLLRGKSYFATDNHLKAAQWFKSSLKNDPYCYEAFEYLVDNNMLTSKESHELLSSLKFTAETVWVQRLYLCKLRKFDFQEKQTTVSLLEELETTHGLKNSLDVVSTQAELLFYQNQFQKCYDITKRVIANDPYNQGALLVAHLSSMVELKLKNEIFYWAHKLVEDDPQSAVAWYGVGCYYYLINNFENARRHFSKSTTLDNHFGAGWLGFGHSFAAQGEHDQAMAAYRTANRVLSGCHLAPLCIAMELMRVSNFNLAMQYIIQSKDICPNDPLVHNELGVIHYRNKEYEKAAIAFSQAIQLCGTVITETWEPTLINLAHSFRKMKQYDNAIKNYSLALSVCPHNPSTYASLGFTYQLQGNMIAAIDYYHKCLAVKPEDSFSNDMLNECLELVHFV